MMILIGECLKIYFVLYLGGGYMEHIGIKLKELRISKGLSIEDVQNATKIRTWYIKAIEDGNLDKLPGKFYEKAFIKTYSELVNLDPTIYNEYLETFSNENIEEVKITDNYYNKEKFSSKLTRWLSKSLVYILVILVIFIIYIFVSNYSDSGEGANGDLIDNKRPSYETDDNNVIQPNDQIPPENNDNDTDKQIKISKLAASTDNSEIYDIYYSDTDPNLNLKVTGPCWISIREGGSEGKEIFRKTLNQNDIFKEIKLDKSLWLRVGNAKNLEILINNQIINLGDAEVSKNILLQPKKIE